MVEHFDEYLDDYLSDTSPGEFIPDYFGRKPPEDRGPLHFFRAYFIDTGEFEILGKSFSLPPLVDEIGRIHNLLLACEAAGSRLPRPNTA
jgi:hypothetical protein